MAKTVRRFSFPVQVADYGPEADNADGYPESTLINQREILAHVYPDPVEGSIVDQLPEGQYRRGRIKVHCEEELQVADFQAGTRGSVVFWHGIMHEVVEVGRREVRRAGVRTWGVYRAQEVVRT